jgi:dihydroflavonol-4-reductase
MTRSRLHVDDDLALYVADLRDREVRFLAIAGESMWVLDVATVLRTRMPAISGKVATRATPSWPLRLAALRNRKLKGLVPLLGLNLDPTSERGEAPARV